MDLDRSTQPTPQLSETARGIISLLLAIHLFTLTIVLGSYTSASPLLMRISDVLGPYARTLNLDLVHAFTAPARLHLTHAGPTDIDFIVRGETNVPQGEPVAWEIPRTGLLPPYRRLRDQNLANAMGQLTDRQNEELEAILPRAVAAAELAKAGAKAGSIRIVAHYLQQLTDVQSPTLNRRDPLDASYYSNVFEARVLAAPGGTVDLLKTSSSARDVAPVTRPNSPTGKSTTAPSRN
jgi:hypothetical protein